MHRLWISVKRLMPTMTARVSLTVGGPRSAMRRYPAACLAAPDLRMTQHNNGDTNRTHPVSAIIDAR